MSPRTCERCGADWGPELTICPDDGGVLRAFVAAPRVSPNTWTLYERPTSASFDPDSPFEIPTDELPSSSFGVPTSVIQRARVADTHPAPRPRASGSGDERDETDGRVYVQMKVRRNAAFSDTDWQERPREIKNPASQEIRGA